MEINLNKRLLNEYVSFLSGLYVILGFSAGLYGA